MKHNGRRANCSLLKGRVKDPGWEGWGVACLVLLWDLWGTVSLHCGMFWASGRISDEVHILKLDIFTFCTEMNAVEIAKIFEAFKFGETLKSIINRDNLMNLDL